VRPLPSSDANPQYLRSSGNELLRMPKWRGAQRRLGRDSNVPVAHLRPRKRVIPSMRGAALPGSDTKVWACALSPDTVSGGAARPAQCALTDIPISSVLGLLREAIRI